MRTPTHWKTRVRRAEMRAETPPLPSAVKKDEAKMLKLTKRKEKAYTRNPRTVISRSSWS